MGIVNLSADSFSGDGAPSMEGALQRAAEQLSHGADLVDIGAESARTNRAAIPVETEAGLLREFVQAFVERWPNAWLSVNTWRPEVAEAVLERGGDLLNDLSGLPDSRNAEICARHGAALLIMHTVGEPKVVHTHIRYDDVMERLEEFFEERIERAVAAGLDREAIVLDPGIDFAKQREDNLRILRDLERLHRFNRPILLPVSRKTVIGEVLGRPDPADRDAGTIACVVAGMRRGASIFRVHNVRAAVDAIRTLEAAIRAQPH